MDELNKTEGASPDVAIEPYRIEVNGERWFTFDQLKRILRVSHTTLYTYIKQDKVIKKDFDGIDLYRLNGYW